MSEWVPHALDVEQEVLGAILLNNSAFSKVEDVLRADHFFEPIHQHIWTICADLIQAGKLASPITIKPFLPVDIDLGGVKLSEYLARLAAAATTITKVRDFAVIVRELYAKRVIGETAVDMKPRPDRDSVDVATWVVERMDEVIGQQLSETTRDVTMDRSVQRAIDAAATAYQNDGRLLGLSYGLSDLDQKTLGAHPGNLIVIAGRPGMGKTALAVSLARNLGIAGRKVMFYSAEMTDVELTQRMIADQMYDDGRFFYTQIRSGKFHDTVFYRIKEAGEYLQTLPIRIVQQPRLTVSQVAARARKMKAREGLDALFVDHIGLVAPSSRYAGNKVHETGEITISLKALAKELNIPIFALAQIVRGVDSRDDKRPQLSDLRNSGDIEQDADTVLLLYREAYYLGRKEPPAGSTEYIIWEQEISACANRLDVEIAKQRSGAVGTVRLFCEIGCNAIRNWQGDFG